MSIVDSLSLKVTVPDYTTLSRRAAKLNLVIKSKLSVKKTDGIVVAVDTTGLSVYGKTQWGHFKGERRRDSLYPSQHHRWKSYNG